MSILFFHLSFQSVFFYFIPFFSHFLVRNRRTFSLPSQFQWNIDASTNPGDKSLSFALVSIYCLRPDNSPSLKRAHRDQLYVLHFVSLFIISLYQNPLFLPYYNTFLQPFFIAFCNILLTNCHIFSEHLDINNFKIYLVLQISIRT